MKKIIVKALNDCIGSKGAGAKPHLNWEGIYFLAVGLLLIFQEYFLTIDISDAVRDYRFLSIYAQLTSSILFAKEYLENPAHLRENEPVIAGQDWVDGRQAAWLHGLRAHHR